MTVYIKSQETWKDFGFLLSHYGRREGNIFREERLHTYMRIKFPILRRINLSCWDSISILSFCVSSYLGFKSGVVNVNTMLASTGEGQEGQDTEEYSNESPHFITDFKFQPN